MELKELQKKTVGELREMATQYEDLEGVTGMKKETLIDVLCQKLGIERKHHLPNGLGRDAMKMEIRALKKRRDEALAAHDHAALKRTRTLMRRAKHRLRSMVAKAEQIDKMKSTAGKAPATSS